MPKSAPHASQQKPRRLRSQLWFDNPENPSMTALYLERYLNFGLFSLSLVGTFLVRSGVLTSVHAFATDPERGTFILLLLVVAIGGSLTLYAFRAPTLEGGGLFAPISREGALVLNNLLLSCGCATVFLGTLYPLFLDAVGGPKLSVGLPVLQPHLRAADGADDARGRHRPDAGLEARRSARRPAAPVGRLRRCRPGGSGRPSTSPTAARSSPCWASASPPGPSPPPC